MNTCMYYDEDHIVSIKFTGANWIKDYKLIQIIGHNRFYGKREELRRCWNVLITLISEWQQTIKNHSRQLGGRYCSDG